MYILDSHFLSSQAKYGTALGPPDRYFPPGHVDVWSKGVCSVQQAVWIAAVVLRHGVGSLDAVAHSADRIQI